MQRASLSFRAGAIRIHILFMPDLAYNGGRARSAGTTAQADLARRLAPSADGLPACGSAQARFRLVPGADRTET